MMVGTAMAAPGSDTASLGVGAVVVNSCAIGSGSVDFGVLGVAVVPGAGTAGVNGNNDADSGATISIVCTNGASATIKAEAGLHDAGAIRKMISGADSLAYELYTDSGRDTVLNPATIAYTGRGFARDG